MGEGEGDAEKLEGAKLVEAEGAEHAAKVEAVQRQVQKMHADVADVANRVRDADVRSKSASASANADFRKFQDKMIAAMDAQKERTEALETAIDGLYRALQAALDEKKETTKSSTNVFANERETNRSTRDGDFRPRLPRGAREREPAVVLPGIRRGDRGGARSDSTLRRKTPCYRPL